jgi:hypothetical protein
MFREHWPLLFNNSIAHFGGLRAPSCKLANKTILLSFWYKQWLSYTRIPGTCFMRNSTIPANFHYEESTSIKSDFVSDSVMTSMNNSCRQHRPR